MEVILAESILLVKVIMIALDVNIGSIVAFIPISICGDLRSLSFIAIGVRGILLLDHMRFIGGVVDLVGEIGLVLVVLGHDEGR